MSNSHHPENGQSPCDEPRGEHSADEEPRGARGRDAQSLNEMDAHAIERSFQEQMQVGGLSVRSIQTYTQAIRRLERYYNRTPASLLTEDNVRSWLAYERSEMHRTAGTLKILIAALKWFYRRTMNCDWELLNSIRPPRESTLPEVLSVGEVHSLIGSVRTFHNQVCLWTIYSLGLRLTEGVNLHVSDIRKDKDLIHIHRGKGAIDRIVPVPIETRQLLRDYWITHKH